MEKALVTVRARLVLLEADRIWQDVLGGSTFSRQAKIEFFRDSPFSGIAYPWDMKVSFNLDYVECYGIKAFNDTIIHEISHLVAETIYGDSITDHHGKEFVDCCTKLGGTGVAHHTFDIQTSLNRKAFKKHYTSLSCPHCRSKTFIRSSDARRVLYNGCLVSCQHCGVNFTYQQR